MQPGMHNGLYKYQCYVLKMNIKINIFLNSLSHFMKIYYILYWDSKRLLEILEIKILEIIVHLCVVIFVGENLS